MAILKQGEVAVLRVRLFDFKRKLVDYIGSIEAQVYSGVDWTPNLSAIKARYDQARSNLQSTIARLDGVIEGRTLDGQLVTAEAVHALVQSIGQDLEALQQAMRDWNKDAPLGQIATYLGKLGDATMGAFNALAEFSLSLSSTASAVFKWLPWIILGAIFLPPMIRIVVRGRKEGTTAALEEAAAQIDEGKRKAGEAGAKVARGAATAAKFFI